METVLRGGRRHPERPPRRVLYLGLNYHPAIGGAEVTDQLLLEAWVARGGAARALFHGSGGATILRGVEVVPVPDPQAMRAQSAAYGPDLIYSQVGTHALGLQLAEALGVPLLTCLHDARPLCPDLEALATCDRNCPACPAYHQHPAHWGRILLQAFDRILVPSRFMAQLAEELLGRRDVEVLHPAVRRVIPETGLPGTAITMSTAEWVKGADIFLRIAERMPDHAFLLAGRGSPGSCGYDPHRHPNVRVAGLLQPARFYGESWLVVMPSRVPEAFGRMAPEAQSAGRLFMGSRLGGIPEAAGDAGVLVDGHLDPESWVQAIRALELDPGRQARLREEGRKAWRRFEADIQAERFCAEVQALLDRPSRASRLFPGKERRARLPWHVPSVLRWTFYGSLGIALLGGPIAFLGGPQTFFAIPLASLLACLALIMGLHAGPLARAKALPAERSGRKLASTILLVACASPIMFLGKWGGLVAWLTLVFLIPRARVHRRQAREARALAGNWL